MSFAKGQELLKLAMMATGRNGVSLEEIVDEWGCSHRTAQRMTDALQAAFPQTEAEDGDDRKRRWRIHAKAIAPLLTPSAQELAALATAIAELDAGQMTAEAATLRQLQSKVRALLPPGAGTRLSVDEEVLLEALGHAARPGPQPVMNSEVNAAISEALKGPFLLRITYRCQSAWNWGPGSARKRGPGFVKLRRSGIGAAELVGVAQPRRARFQTGMVERDRQARFLKRQLSLPVSMMSQ